MVIVAESVPTPFLVNGRALLSTEQEPDHRDVVQTRQVSVSSAPSLPLASDFFLPARRWLMCSMRRAQSPRPSEESDRSQGMGHGTGSSCLRRNFGPVKVAIGRSTVMSPLRGSPCRASFCDKFY